MNKKELISKVARKTGQTRENTSQLLDAVIETITESLSNETEVRLNGFGRFYVKPYKARTIHAPNAKEVFVPEHYVPHFKAYKMFKESVTCNEHGVLHG